MKKVLAVLILLLSFSFVSCTEDATKTIVFQTNGGSEIASLDLNANDVFVLPANPTKDGYTFVGWYLDETCTEEPFSQDTFSAHQSESTITLYALWSLNTVEETSFTIIFQLEDGTVLLTYTVNAGVTPIYTGETPKKDSTSTEAYTFSGWSPAITSATQNQTYTAQFTAQTIEVSSFDPTDLNAIIGYDIYADLPEISSSDYLIIDDSGDGETWAYVDCFDWTEEDALDYMDALDLVFSYDDTEESWIIGDFFLYVYEDTDTYPGETVYGIGIYSYGENNQSTSFDETTLNNYAGFDAYSLMPTISTNDYDVFDFSDATFLEIYVDIFDWTENNALDYMDALDLVLSYDDTEESWIIGDYFLYVYEDTDTYPGETVYGIGIYGDKTTEVVTYPDFDSAFAKVFTFFNNTTLESIIPSMSNVGSLTITQLTSQKLSISGVMNASNNQTVVNDWIASLQTNGFVLDNTLSTNNSANVYVYNVNTDLSYALYVTLNTNDVTYTIWSFDPSLESETLSTLPVMESINQYEEATFGKSGLPSTGTFDVLVIPVEIQGYPFPADYLANLDILFNGTPAQTGWQSVSSFYQTSSYGKLNMTFDIANKYTTTHPKSYYEGYGSDGDQYAIYEALLALDSSIDFSHYDTNNDGTIDAVYFIYSVNYDYEQDPWWAWVYAAQYGKADEVGLLDGKEFAYYMWASYSFSQDTIEGYSGLILDAETYIHESGHLMGALDMYSYTEDYGPTGSMGMMDYNCGDHDPFHKVLFGWSTPYVTVGTGIYDVTLESYALDTDGLGSALVIPYSNNEFADGDAFDEFLIIMFYTPEGLYNAHVGLPYVLDHAGIIVYHVDARLYNNPSFWDTYFSYNNDGTSDFFAELLEADNNNSLDYSDISMSDILTAGSFDLSGYSWHQGGSMNITITVNSVITDTSDNVSFTVTVE
ncbi:MAG: InlB B-repeat-containing protein [Candidatus Izemoplasmatales bacterium]